MEKLKLVCLISFRNVQTEKENSVKKKKKRKTDYYKAM